MNENDEAHQQQMWRELRAGRHRDRTPTYAMLIEWAADSGCEATDGCWVETDGRCKHGCPSWQVELGLI